MNVEVITTAAGSFGLREHDDRWLVTTSQRILPSEFPSRAAAEAWILGNVGCR